MGTVPEQVTEDSKGSLWQQDTPFHCSLYPRQRPLLVVAQIYFPPEYSNCLYVNEKKNRSSITEKEKKA